MSGKVARYQGGSIVSFVIIAAVIATVIGGGLFLLRQRSGQAGHEPTVATEEVSSPQTESDKQPTTEEFPASSSNKSEKTEESEKPASNDLPTNNKTGEVAASATDTLQTAALPETGPGQVIALPVVAMIVYAAVAFMRSAHQLVRLRS